MIAERLEITHIQVRFALNTTKLTPKKSSGRNPLLSSPKIDEVEAYITSSQEGRQMLYFEVANFVFLHFGVSEKLIEREMKKRGYTRRIAASKSPLVPENLRKRYDFVRNHPYWEKEDWMRVLWTDESWVTDGRHTRCWITRKMRSTTTHVLLAIFEGELDGSLGIFFGSEKGLCLFWEKEWGSITAERYNLHKIGSSERLNSNRMSQTDSKFHISAIRRPTITEFQRYQVKELHKAGKPRKEIAAQLNLSNRQVSYVIERDTELVNKTVGLPPVINKERVDEIEAFICSTESNRRMGFGELASGPFQHWNVHDNMISHALKKRGYSRQRICDRPMLSEEQKSTRKQWATSHLHWTMEDWENILWTYGNWDTPKYISKTFATMKPGERFASFFPIEIASKQIDWMFWGSFAGSEKGPCLLWEKDIWGSMNLENYCEKIIPLIDDVISQKPWLAVMQDDSLFLSRIAINEELHEQKINTISWPPDSPDLNPIQPVWNLMQNFIRVTFPDSENGEPRSYGELYAVIMEAWDSVTPDQLRELVRSMPDRCQAVLDADGGYIKS
ncbi:hypothetical protein K3495_g4523 [Podosphaera aphanis]|nr:hypothetical protein K3495_g4523 [Podosphaera aphanis]